MYASRFDTWDECEVLSHTWNVVCGYIKDYFMAFLAYLLFSDLWLGRRRWLMG